MSHSSAKVEDVIKAMLQMQEQRTNQIAFRREELATRGCLDAQLPSRPCSLRSSFGRRCNLPAAVTRSVTAAVVIAAAAAAAAAQIRKPGPQPEMDPRSHTQKHTAHLQSLRQGCTPPPPSPNTVCRGFQSDNRKG